VLSVVPLLFWRDVCFWIIVFGAVPTVEYCRWIPYCDLFRDQSSAVKCDEVTYERYEDCGPSGQWSVGTVVFNLFLLAYPRM
jgi:hypothetical protein